MKPNRARRDSEYRVYKLWRQTCAPLIAYTDEAVSGVIRAMCKAAADGLAREAAALPGCPRADEAIYACLERLMAAYRAAPFAPPPNGGKAAEIWGGVCAVFASRVHLAEEWGNQGGNPIAAEKKRIVTDCVKELLAGCEAAAKQFRAGEQAGCEDMILRGAAAGEDRGEAMAALASEGFAALLAPLYTRAVEGARAALNDLTRRDVARRYEECLAEESEILSAIVNYQSQAIEAELGEPYQPMEDIRRVYGEAVSAAKAFAAARQTGGITQKWERGDAAYPWDGARAAVKPPPAFGAAYAAFRSLAEQEAGRADDEALKRGAYMLTKQIYEHDALAREMIAAFETITAQAERGDEIVKGICETVEIKLDSLKDGLAQMKADAAALLDEGRGAGQAAKAERTKTAADRLTEALLRAGRDRAAALAAAKPAVPEAAPPAAALAAAKRLAAFKKECLLSELSTFEEILHYSVPRLQGAGEAAEAFAGRVQAAMARLTGVLARYGIETINPAPHEAFNPKEHDVLTAEPQEGFRKGEIVKVMNCGYKQDGVVLLRANVIAAR